MPISGEDGLKAMLVARAAAVSMTLNRSVRIDEF